MIRTFLAILAASSMLFISNPDMVSAGEDNQPRVVKFDRKESYGDWTLHCGKDQEGVERCILGIGLWNEEKRRIAGIVLQKTPDGSGLMAHISLPLGISLLKPAALQMGEKIYGFPITHCDQEGCHGRLILNGELLRHFRHRNEGVLLMKLLDERTVKIPFSLKGSRAGMEQIK